MCPVRGWSCTLVVSAVCAVACDAPTAPKGSSPLPFHEGVYELALVGSDGYVVGEDSVRVGCAGLAGSGLGGVLYTSASLALEDRVWAARPTTAADGSFLIRFSVGSEGPAAPGGGVGVAATASGIANATILHPFEKLNTDLRLSFSSTSQSLSTLSGGISRDGLTASGTSSSPMVLSNTEGTTVSCNAGGVLWSLSR
jgi:hypothetical protein